MKPETPLNQAAIDMEERRFCSSCGRTKPLLGGALVRCANGAKRWKCADCRAKSKAHQATKTGGS
ncbi:MAG: hypothetical protein COW48_04460 [Hydrogenophilales bacterium CG17_big_fil_post_rev_8_21_14_2_50_63_12]|nr:MAG: hypothetical protein COW48_04460 [Hydrogenophilales bacterium CG17_big_fil_post_rev_8_21_14_2_50_63_12]PIX97900.1 MAG: hypothetical protein COZ24_02930 [Hydrogenophilales bacterium CG_4_10_14_3_um_filter_63_21]PJB03221.1 MAG: hypothetical protein CO126_07910 [Hydrogenophilales bacterium CG_4_9_14_3_um_filter_63_34]